MIDMLCVLLIKRACKLPIIHDVHNTARIFVLLNHIINSFTMAHVQNYCIHLEIPYRSID